MQQYFVEQVVEPKGTVTLSKTTSHHFLDVMRAKIGQTIEIADITGKIYLATLAEIQNKLACMQVVERIDRNNELPIEVTIVCGLSKNNKPELIVQKATELGTNEIIFLPMKRSIVDWKNKAQPKIDRLQEVALNAAQQSHRNLVPQVKYFGSLNEIFLNNFDARLVAYEESAKQGEASTLKRVVNDLKAGSKLVGIFGPEGGIDEKEVAVLMQNDYQFAGLGPRILRAETAPLYFLSSISVIKEL